MTSVVCLADRALDAVAVRVRNMCRAWAREAHDKSLKINLAKRLRLEEDYGSSRAAIRQAEIGPRSFQQRSAPVPAAAAGPERFTSEERQEAFRVKEILGGQDRVCFQFVKSGKRCQDCTFVPCNIDGRREGAQMLRGNESNGGESWLITSGFGRCWLERVCKG